MRHGLMNRFVTYIVHGEIGLGFNLPHKHNGLGSVVSTKIKTKQ